MAGKTMQYAGPTSVSVLYAGERHRMIQLAAIMDAIGEAGARNVAGNRGRRVTVEMSPELAMKHGLALIADGLTEIEFEKIASALGSLDGFTVRSDFRHRLHAELTAAIETAKAVAHLEVAEKVKRIEEREAARRLPIDVIEDSTDRGFDPTAYADPGYRGRGTEPRLDCPCGRSTSHVPSAGACYFTRRQPGELDSMSVTKGP